MTRYLIMLENTDTGFAVQVPDLAISTFGEASRSKKRKKRSRVTSTPIEMPVSLCRKPRRWRSISRIQISKICCSPT